MYCNEATHMKHGWAVQIQLEDFLKKVGEEHMVFTPIRHICSHRNPKVVHTCIYTSDGLSDCPWEAS
jgi:hypothetical protein